MYKKHDVKQYSPFIAFVRRFYLKLNEKKPKETQSPFQGMIL